MHTIVLIRHGESEWNKKNLFTGWTDVPITEKGEGDVRKAAKTLAERGYVFDRAYTSFLKRSIKTLWVMLEEMDLMWIPVEKSWKLNERHYGGLTGLNKQEATEKEGEEQVFLWRRGFSVCPPAMQEDDPRSPRKDPKYKDVDPTELPLTECLENTYDRVVGYWEKEIAPRIQKGEMLLVSCHGSTLRALLKYFENMSDDEVSECNVPCGIPILFKFDEQMFFVGKEYLGDEEYVAKCIAEVANQHKA